MAVDEAARRALFDKLEEQLGPEPASTLMESLPPVPLTDFATRRDIERDLDVLEHKLLAAMRQEINAQTRLLFFSMIGALFTAVSLAFAAAQFA